MRKCAIRNARNHGRAARRNLVVSRLPNLGLFDDDFHSAFFWNVRPLLSSSPSMSPMQLANLFDAHAPALLLYARQWGASGEDLVQDAFVKLAGQRTPPAEVVPWLYRVVRNAAIDAGKLQHRRTRREQIVARSTAWFAEADIEGLDAATAADALQSLPLEAREVIVAHLWGGLTFEQIAALAGTSASTAYRHYQAGLDRLREKLRVP